MTAKEIGYLQTKMREINSEVSLLEEKMESFTMSIDTKIRSAQQIIVEFDKKREELRKENKEREKFSEFLIGMRDKSEEIHRRSFTKLTKELNDRLEALFINLSKECRLDIVDSVVQTQVLISFLSQKGIIPHQEFVDFIDKRHDQIVNFVSSEYGDWKLTVPKLFMEKLETDDEPVI